MNNTILVQYNIKLLGLKKEKIHPNFLENAALMSCALRTIESDLRTYTDVDIMGTGYKPEKIKSLPVPLQFQILNPQNQLTFIEW